MTTPTDLIQGAAVRLRPSGYVHVLKQDAEPTAKPDLFKLVFTCNRVAPSSKVTTEFPPDAERCPVCVP